MILQIPVLQKSCFTNNGRNQNSRLDSTLSAADSDEALKEWQCQNWFAKFRSGDFSLKNEKRSGRPVEVDDDLIKAIIDSDRHNTTLEEKWPELTNRKAVVFHHDNARPHTSLVTRQKLLELGWDVLPHPPYSPDHAPSDYFLFRSLQNSLNGKNFNNDDDVKSYL
ncbi:histone-lysine N-methyltransferase SETMAR [Trichonephila clavipes]|nr:histone-lysine N-methyltransferase SETMAR [Trichonephila clavipes]